MPELEKAVAALGNRAAAAAPRGRRKKRLSSGDAMLRLRDWFPRRGRKKPKLARANADAWGENSLWKNAPIDKAVPVTPKQAAE
jgi:hypothetical protein